MIERSTDQMPRELGHFSYSQFKTLSQCGMKFLIEKGYGVYGQPNWASVGGSAVHSVTEIWDRDYAFKDNKPFDLYSWWGTAFEAAIVSEEGRNSVPRADFRPTGRKSAKWPNKRDHSWWMENGPILVNNWISWRESSPWEIASYCGELAIEVAFEMVIGDLAVVGKIDRVFFTPNNDLVIVDIKTGAPEAGYNQLGTYHVGLRNSWPIPQNEMVYGSFWMAQENELTPPIDLTYMDKPFLDQQYWRAKQIRDQGLFLATVDKHCGWCSAKAHCPAFGGSLPLSVVERKVETDEDTTEGE